MVKLNDLRNHNGDVCIALFNAKNRSPGNAEKALVKGGVSAEGDALI